MITCFSSLNFSGSLNNYVKYPNLACVEFVSSTPEVWSFDDAKSNCSKSEKCSAIQISEFHGKQKIKLCKIAKKKYFPGNSCVHKKGNMSNRACNSKICSFQASKTGLNIL